MAKYVLEETITAGQAKAAIWDRLRQYCLDGKTVELVRRSVGGKMVIEVRRWKSIRTDASNAVAASPSIDY